MSRVQRNSVDAQHTAGASAPAPAAATPLSSSASGDAFRRDASRRGASRRDASRRGAFQHQRRGIRGGGGVVGAMGNLVVAVLLVAGAAVLAALLPWIGDRDPAVAVFRAREAERAVGPEVLAAIRAELNLPTSATESVVRALRGDFGSSWVDKSRAATTVAWESLPVSLALALASTALACVLAFGLALPRLRRVVRGRRAGAGDISAMAVVAAIPEFVLAAVLLTIFGVMLRWFPVTGLSFLPVAALAIPSAGLLGRVLLITIDGVAGEGWVDTWRINGVPARHIARAITFRAAATLAPLVVLFFAGTVASTVLVEATFGIRGFGSTALAAAVDQDVPVLQVVLVTAVGLGIIAGAVAHRLRAWVMAPMLTVDGETSAARQMSKPHGFIPAVMVMAPLVAVCAGWWRDPGLDPARRLMPPGPQLPLGADQLGRDLWARVADGAVLTIGTAIAVTAVCALIGGALGLSGRWAAQIGDAMNALPAVLLGLVLAGVFGGSLWTAALAVVLVGWIPLAAHASTVAAEARSTGFYRWAALQGASRWRLVRVHVLPQVVRAVARHAASRVSHNALALAGLGFLGVGAAHDSPEWGVVLSESIRYAERAPWVMATPTVLLILLGVATAIVTDMDVRPRMRIPRMRSTRRRCPRMRSTRNEAGQ